MLILPFPIYDREKEAINVKIEQIELYISNYEETVSFYKNILEFRCISENNIVANFQTGSSILTLHKDENNSYYYHFAFNIPPNLFNEAKKWIQQRISLATEDGEDEVHFVESKAKSFYFEDPAGNIVEYIARETTAPATEETFTPMHVVNISEIGLTSQDIKKNIEKIQKLGISSKNNEPISYDQYLNFMGEYEDGVYIIVAPVGRRWIFSDKKGIVAPLLIKTNRGVINSSEN